MRMFFSRRRWMSVGIVCLSAGSMIGCRSPGAGPGMGWFSWMSPKPSTALASNPPTKPSLASLPTPNATTGASNQAQAANNSLGVYAAANGAHNHSHSSTSAPSSYATGPYGMTSGPSGTAGASNGLAASGYGAGSHAAGSHNHSHSSGSYAGSGAQSASSGPSYGGYQSPYANPTARTADARSSYGTADSHLPRYGTPSATANSYATQPSTAPAMGGGSVDPLNRNSPYNASASTPASYNDYSGARGYADPTPESVTGSAGGYTAPATAGNSYLDRFNTGTSNGASPTAPAAPRGNSGSYQPGSTSRNGGNFPVSPASNPVQPASTTANVNAGYPSTSYPSTAYPTVDSRATMGTTGAPGANAYPSSAPLLR